MQIFFIIRAINEHRRKFIAELEAQYFTFKFKKDGVEMDGVINLSVREWGGMVELAFPEPCLEEVVNMLKPWRDAGWLKIWLYGMRKALNLEKIPEFPEPKTKRPTCKMAFPDILIYPIGLKKDEFGTAPDGHGGTYEGEKI